MYDNTVPQSVDDETTEKVRYDRTRRDETYNARIASAFWALADSGDIEAIALSTLAANDNGDTDA